MADNVEYYLSGTTSTAIDTRRQLWVKMVRRERTLKSDTRASTQPRMTNSLRDLRVKFLRALNL